MAREAKLLITSSDKSSPGIDSAVNNVEGMGRRTRKVAEDTNKSIIEMAKESKRQMEGINAALQLGGWLIAGQQVVRVLADITKEARENSAAFKTAGESFSAAKLELGTSITSVLEPMVVAIGNIAGEWAKAAKNTRDYNQALVDVDSANKLVAARAASVIASYNLQRAQEEETFAAQAASSAAGITSLQERATFEQNFREGWRKAEGEFSVNVLAGIADATRKAFEGMAPLTRKPSGIPGGALANLPYEDPFLMYRQRYQQPFGGVEGDGPLGAQFGGGSYFQDLARTGGPLRSRFAPTGFDLMGIRAPAISTQAAEDALTFAQPSGGSPFAGLLDAISPLIGMFKQLGSLRAILDPLMTIFQGIMDVLGPAIDAALKPLVDLLLIIGNTIGQLLLPVVEAMGTVIGWVSSALLDFVNWIRSLFFQPALSSPVKTYSATTTGGGGGASYAGAQAITFNFYNQGNVVGAGGMQELAGLIEGLIAQRGRYA